MNNFSLQPFSGLTALTSSSFRPAVEFPLSLQPALAQSSTVDITQLSWEGFKRSIAAGGPPTTPLGKFFDWLT